LKQFALVLLALLLPEVAFAAPDGKEIVLHGNQTGALPCAACHGANGAGNESIGAPALAGLPAGMITGYLQRFAAGRGGNAIMQSIAKGLSPDEVTAVATYYAGLKQP